MKTIYLVTGAAGFMGTNVCAQLLERGDAVRAFVLKGDPAVKIHAEGRRNFLRVTSAVPRTARNSLPWSRASRLSASTARAW